MLLMVIMAFGEQSRSFLLFLCRIFILEAERDKKMASHKSRVDHGPPGMQPRLQSDFDFLQLQPLFHRLLLFPDPPFFPKWL